MNRVKLALKGKQSPRLSVEEFGQQMAEAKSFAEKEAQGKQNDEETNVTPNSVPTEAETLASIYNEVEWPVPDQKFLKKFPIYMERALQPFDDFFIKVCQSAKGKVLTIIHLLITGLVAIETGIAAPFVFFVVGWDGLAIEMTYLMLVLSFMSQIPKRFVWRYRPYMVGRALKMRAKESAVTSSFPSRAVTCAVVYSFFASYAYIITYEPNHVVIKWWMPVIFIVTILLASVARVALGVHYPSDCVIGFFQGVLVCILGTLLWRANGVGCSSCYDNSCYSGENTENIVTPHTLNKFNWISLLVCTAVATLITFLSTLKPIDFWDKCDRIYGMLLPGITFRITLLCPRTVHSSLGIPIASPWYGYVYGLGIALIATIIAFKNKGRYPVLSFLVQFVVLYFCIAIWRIWVLS